jgi:hypothetical protein
MQRCSALLRAVDGLCNLDYADLLSGMLQTHRELQRLEGLLDQLDLTDYAELEQRLETLKAQEAELLTKEAELNRAVGASAVRVAAAARWIATSVATSSGVAVGSAVPVGGGRVAVGGRGASVSAGCATVGGPVSVARARVTSPSLSAWGSGAGVTAFSWVQAPSARTRSKARTLLLNVAMLGGFISTPFSKAQVLDTPGQLYRRANRPPFHLCQYKEEILWPGSAGGH